MGGFKGKHRIPHIPLFPDLNHSQVPVTTKLQSKLQSGAITFSRLLNCSIILPSTNCCGYPFLLSTCDRKRFITGILSFVCFLNLNKSNCKTATAVFLWKRVLILPHIIIFMNAPPALCCTFPGNKTSMYYLIVLFHKVE